MQATKRNWITTIKQASANFPGEKIRAVGLLPLVSVIASVGICSIAFSYWMAQMNYPGGLLLFWLGVIFIYAPISLRLVSQNTTRNERITLVVLLGLSLYLIKVLKSPLFFNIHDEFAHWRTTFDIIANHRLFLANPLKPISPLFPGMEVLTAYVSELVGIDIFPVGISLLFVSRIIAVIALFLFFEKVANSSYIAGLAVSVYLANPNFVFFDAQFAYESISLPFAFLVLLLLLFREELPERDYDRLSGVSIFFIFIITISHHLTSYFVTLFLLVWQFISLGKRDLTVRNIVNYFYLWYSGEIAGQGVRSEWRRLISNRPKKIKNETHEKSMAYSFIPLAALTLSSLWLLVVANKAVGYLFPHFSRQVKEVLSMMSLEGSSRALFVSGGQSAPIFGQLISYAAVLLILFGIGYGIYILQKTNAKKEVILLMAIGGFFYPITLVARLTPHGWEISNRSSEFIFIAIGFLLAIAINHFLSQKNAKTWRNILISAVLTLIFIGGMNIGWPYWDILPGRYLVADGPRSIEAEGLSASYWMKDAFGPNNRIAADRVNTRLLGSYGEQTTITAYGQNIRIAPVFFADSFSSKEKAVIKDGNVNFFLVDRRLCTALPMVGVYFEDGEPDSLNHRSPIPCSALDKFSSSALFNKVYDSGSIGIYQVLPNIMPDSQEAAGDIP
jgi:hypothetical protein